MGFYIGLCVPEAVTCAFCIFCAVPAGIVADSRVMSVLWSDYWVVLWPGVDVLLTGPTVASTVSTLAPTSNIFSRNA